MKLYLAGRYSRREELCQVKAHLGVAGHIVTSRWLLGDHQVNETELSTEAEHGDRVRFAEEDFRDVIESEGMIVFTETPRATNSRGGRHVELGIGLAWNYLASAGVVSPYPVFVVGPRENVFCCLPAVTWYPTWEECALKSFGIIVPKKPLESQDQSFGMTDRT